MKICGKQGRYNSKMLSNTTRREKPTAETHRHYHVISISRLPLQTHETSYFLLCTIYGLLLDLPSPQYRNLEGTFL